jgi:hypothetical protein
MPHVIFICTPKPSAIFSDTLKCVYILQNELSKSMKRHHDSLSFREPIVFTGSLIIFTSDLQENSCLYSRYS